jgi:hypothetical protein
MCRRTNIQPHMAATLYPLHVPLVPLHTVGLDYLTRLLLSNSFDGELIVVDHVTRMAHFRPCTESVTAKETVIVFLQGAYIIHQMPRVLVNHWDPKFASVFW